MKYTKTKEILNQLVADLSQFAAIIHQTHWYLRGPEFLSLHPKMDDYMDEINEQLDEVAERLITIDGKPWSTLSEFAQHTQLKDEPGTFDKSTPQRIERLVEGYRYLVDLYQKGIDTAGEEDDFVTQDMLIGFTKAVEKNIWMMQAALSKEPGNDK